ncbi:MAG: hypothetical protein ABJB16_06910, partial [Saprospiraceae bacterium]
MIFIIGKNAFVDNHGAESYLWGLSARWKYRFIWVNLLFSPLTFIQLKKFLLITYYWPPSGGAGVMRWAKMTKYIP